MLLIFRSRLRGSGRHPILTTIINWKLDYEKFPDLIFGPLQIRFIKSFTRQNRFLLQ
jgi:hypothetical protein